MPGIIFFVSDELYVYNPDGGGFLSDGGWAIRLMRASIRTVVCTAIRRVGSGMMREAG
jgi:hypothetical protein